MASTVYCVTVDDAGDVYVLLGSSIRKYDSGLNFITSYSVTFPESYTHQIDSVSARIHWSEGYLWCVFKEDCSEIYKLKDDFTESYSLIASITPIGAIALMASILM